MIKEKGKSNPPRTAILQSIEGYENEPEFTQLDFETFSEYVPHITLIQKKL